jgi:hypothetical protein
MLEISGFWFVFAAGIFGGFVAEAVRWYKVRESENYPTYLKSPLYWVATLIMIIVGGFLASIYGVNQVNALLAINIGASAPLIITTLVSAAPNKEKPLIASFESKPKSKTKKQLIKDFLSAK